MATWTSLASFQGFPEFFPAFPLFITILHGSHSLCCVFTCSKSNFSKSKSVINNWTVDKSISTWKSNSISKDFVASTNSLDLCQSSPGGKKKPQNKKQCSSKSISIRHFKLLLTEGTKNRGMYIMIATYPYYFLELSWSLELALKWYLAPWVERRMG